MRKQLRGWTILLLSLVAAGVPATQRDPATIRQYEDNRVFQLPDGRKAVGCELNAQAVPPNARQWTRSNRIINPKPLSDKAPLEWEVKAETPVVDGTGTLLGTVAPQTKVGEKLVTSSKFNYGQHKEIDGRTYIYAFAVDITPASGGKAEGVSAWLPLDCVVDQDTLKARIGLDTPRLPALALEEKTYRITGGNPAAYHLDGLPELRITSSVNSGAVPSHYLLRPCGTVNILYSVPGFGLGGQGTDAILASANATFTPANGVRAIVVPTYYPRGHDKAGEKSEKTMTFLYGRVEANNREIAWGWVAREAMEEVK